MTSWQMAEAHDLELNDGKPADLQADYNVIRSAWPEIPFPPNRPNHATASARIAVITVEPTVQRY